MPPSKRKSHGGNISVRAVCRRSDIVTSLQSQANPRLRDNIWRALNSSDPTDIAPPPVALPLAVATVRATTRPVSGPEALPLDTVGAACKFP